MPFGTNFHQQVLTDEQAWNIAVFVRSQPPRHKVQSEDWENISDKPFDFPIGSYVDSFSEKQHKYEPFQPIIEAIKNHRI